MSHRKQSDAHFIEFKIVNNQQVIHTIVNVAYLKMITEGPDGQVPTMEVAGHNYNKPISIIERYEQITKRLSLAGILIPGGLIEDSPPTPKESSK